jgi:hypothetical protein
VSLAWSDAHLSQFGKEIPPMILKSGRLHYCSSQIAAKDIAERSFNFFLHALRQFTRRDKLPHFLNF